VYALHLFKILCLEKNRIYFLNDLEGLLKELPENVVKLLIMSDT